MIDLSRTSMRVSLIGALALIAWFVGRGTRTPESPPVTSPQASARMAAVTAPALPAPVTAPVTAATFPRPPEEWQGMLVSAENRQYCEASSYCGFALACLEDNACGACTADAQCATGEACVLDHCIRAANVGCRSRADCGAEGPDARCMLSGLTGGEPRGNSEMISFCRRSSGGIAQDEAAPDPRRDTRMREAAAQTAVAPPVSADDLRTRLDAELATP